MGRNCSDRFNNIDTNLFPRDILLRKMLGNLAAAYFILISNIYVITRCCRIIVQYIHGADIWNSNVAHVEKI